MNKILNSNKLKLGIFGTNGKGGAQTLVPEAYKPTWKGAVETAQIADRVGFEAILAYARWKPYMPGKPNHPSGVVFDPFTWCAAISQVTESITVIPTAHAPTIHPITCAKQCATIDIVSGGRMALNVVGGWNKHELEMFGAPLREHDARYDQLEEWLKVIEMMWNEEEELDFSGQFYTVVRGSSMPKPIQRPRPPIVNAGGSPRGMRFACEYADICFVILKSEDPEECKKQIDEYKNYARNEFGRNVQVWTYCPVVQRDTRKEAEDYLHYYAVEMEDTESLDAWSAGLASQTQIASPDVIRQMRMRFAAGAGGIILLGTADDIANQLQMLNEAGLDGVLFTWVDFHDGLERFCRDVLPLLESRGLREPLAKKPNVMSNHRSDRSPGSKG